MRTFIFILAIVIIFAIGYALLLWLVEMYLKKRYKRDINRKIKTVMFRELGFTYRETAGGKKFIIIDCYEGDKAIQV